MSCLLEIMISQIANGQILALIKRCQKYQKIVQVYCMCLVGGGSICQEHQQLKQMPDAQIRCQILPTGNFFGLLSAIQGVIKRDWLQHWAPIIIQCMKIFHKGCEGYCSR